MPTKARRWRPRGAGWLRPGLVTLGAWALLLGVGAMIRPVERESGCRLVAQVAGGWALPPMFGPGEASQRTQRELRAMLPPALCRPWPARVVGRPGATQSSARDVWWLVPADGGRRCYLEAWRWSASTHRPVRWLGRDGFRDRRPGPDAWFACAADPLCAHDNSSGDLLLCVDGGLLLVTPEQSRTSWLLPPQGIVAAADTKAPTGTLAELGPRWLPESRSPNDDERLIVARTHDSLLLYLKMSHQTFRRPLPAGLARDGGRLALLPDGGLAISDGPRVDWLSARRPVASPAYRLDRTGRVVEQRPGRAGLPEYPRSDLRWLSADGSRGALALLLALLLAWRCLAPASAGRRCNVKIRRRWSREPGRGQVWALMVAEWRASAPAVALGGAVVGLAGDAWCAPRLATAAWTMSIHTDLLLGLAPALAWAGLLVAAGLGWWQARRESWDQVLCRTTPARLLAAKVAAGLSGVVAVHLLAAVYISLRLLGRGACPLTYAMVAPSYRAWPAPCSAWLLAYALALWAGSAKPALRWSALGWMGVALAGCLVTGGQLVGPASRSAELAPLIERLGPREPVRAGLVVSTDGTVWAQQPPVGQEPPLTQRLGVLALRRGAAADRDWSDARPLDWAPLPATLAATSAGASRDTLIVALGSSYHATAWYAVLRRPDQGRYHLVAYDRGRRGPVCWITRRGRAATRPRPEDDLDLRDGGLVGVDQQRVTLCDRGRVLTYGVDGRECQTVEQLPGLRAAVSGTWEGYWLADDHQVRLPDGTQRPLGELAGRRLYVASELRDGALLVADGRPRQAGTTLYSLDAAGGVIDRLTLGKESD